MVVHLPIQPWVVPAHPVQAQRRDLHGAAVVEVVSASEGVVGRRLAVHGEAGGAQLKVWVGRHGAAVWRAHKGVRAAVVAPPVLARDSQGGPRRCGVLRPRGWREDAGRGYCGVQGESSGRRMRQEVAGRVHHLEKDWWRSRSSKGISKEWALFRVGDESNAAS